ELPAENVGVAAPLVADPLLADRQHVIVELEARLIADVEGGMSVEDLQPAEQQEEQAHCPDPMGYPRPGELAIDQWPLAGGRRWRRRIVGRSLWRSGCRLSSRVQDVKCSLLRGLPRASVAPPWITLRPVTGLRYGWFQ